MCEENKRVAFARRIRLGREEGVHELGSIGYEVLEFAIDRIDCKDRVFAHVRVAVFEARTAGWYKGFQELSVFREFLEKAQSCATDVFIGMLLIK